MDSNVGLSRFWDDLFRRGGSRSLTDRVEGEGSNDTDPENSSETESEPDFEDDVECGLSERLSRTHVAESGKPGVFLFF